MIPAAILVTVVAGALGLVMIYFVVETKAQYRELRRDHTRLRKEHEAMREAIDELLIGHVNQARLKRVLAQALKEDDRE